METRFKKNKGLQDFMDIAIKIYEILVGLNHDDMWL